jgi:hypothetical protein
MSQGINLKSLHNLHINILRFSLLSLARESLHIFMQENNKCANCAK